MEIGRPILSAGTKTCALCGLDISNSKRVKDPSGQYYCEPCYAAATAQLHTAAPPTAAPTEAPASVDPYDLQPMSPPPDPKEASTITDEHGLIDLAEPQDSSASSGAMLGCAHCKKLFPEKQARIDDGEFLCPACYALRHASGRSTPNAVVGKYKITDDAIASPTGPSFIHTLAGGLLLAAGAALLAWAVLVVLMLVVQPMPEFEDSILVPLIAGSLYWFSAMIMAALLLVSMLLLDRLMGGVDFGFIGVAISKAVLIGMSVTALNLLAQRYESLEIFLLIFGGILYLIGFILIFRIDYFEAVILSFINSGIYVVIALFLASTILHALYSFGFKSRTILPYDRTQFTLPAN